MLSNVKVLHADYAMRCVAVGLLPIPAVEYNGMGDRLSERVLHALSYVEAVYVPSTPRLFQFDYRTNYGF